jgi:Fur family transcriptional regulator, iron response regulator
MKPDLAAALREHGIRPSAQRMAVATYVLTTEEHPVADQVWQRVRARFPMLSRATVYNTLNLFVRKGLLRQLTLDEGSVVYDPRMNAHHHFIDESSGQIHDVPWEAVRVEDIHNVPGVDVHEYMVVMRGRKRGEPPRKSVPPKRKQGEAK